MTKNENKWERSKSGEISTIICGVLLAISGILILVVGFIASIFLQDYMVMTITAVGGLIIMSLGLIMIEQEAQTMLFIAYVEDFVKPRQKTVKTNKKKN